MRRLESGRSYFYHRPHQQHEAERYRVRLGKSVVNARSLVFWFALTFLLAIIVGPVSAEFQGDTDWQNNQRELCYEFDDSITDQWEEWIEEAIENWNDVSDETGWSFRECKEDEDTDITFELSDDNDPNGGATTTMTRNPAGTGPKVHEQIHIDEDLSDEVWPGGERATGGWGTSGADTLDPILVLKHELTHVMRLNHSNGSDSGHLEDPITPGNHDNPDGRKPSENDQSEAEEAAEVDDGERRNIDVGPEGGQGCLEEYYERFFEDEIKFVCVDVPPGAVEQSATLTLEPVVTGRIPDPLLGPLAEPGNVITAAVFFAVNINRKPAGEFSRPIQISMRYSEADLAGGFILDSLHSAELPPFDESSFRGYRYDPDGEVWNILDSTLDLDRRTVIFSTSELGIFGVGGKTAAESLVDGFNDCTAKFDQNSVRLGDPLDCDPAQDTRKATVRMNASHGPNVQVYHGTQSHQLFGPELIFEVELYDPVFPDGPVRDIPDTFYQFAVDVDDKASTGNNRTPYFPADMGVDLEVLTILRLDPAPTWTQVVLVWNSEREEFVEFGNVASSELVNSTRHLITRIPLMFLNQSLQFHNGLQISADMPLTNWISFNWQVRNDLFVADYYPNSRFP